MPVERNAYKSDEPRSESPALVVSTYYSELPRGRLSQAEVAGGEGGRSEGRKGYRRHWIRISRRDGPSKSLNWLTSSEFGPRPDGLNACEAARFSDAGQESFRDRHVAAGDDLLDGAVDRAADSGRVADDGVVVAGRSPVAGFRGFRDRPMERGDRLASTGLAFEAVLEEVPHERVVAEVVALHAASPAQQAVALGLRCQPPHVGRGEVGHDSGELGCHDLEDRGPHEELLEVVRQVPDHLLGEVVVQLLIRTTEVPHEPADLEG